MSGQAVILRSKGGSACDIAAICKREEDWVCRAFWVYNEGGLEALEEGCAENGRDPVLEDGLYIALS